METGEGIFMAVTSITWLADVVSLGQGRCNRLFTVSIDVDERRTESDLYQRTDFWEESIREQIRSGMIEIIESHRQQGHILALLTASSNYLSDLVATELNISICVVQSYRSLEWSIDWHDLEPLCFGSGK